MDQSLLPADPIRERGQRIHQNVPRETFKSGGGLTPDRLRWCSEACEQFGMEITGVQKSQLVAFFSLLETTGTKQNVFSRRGNSQETIASQVRSSLRAHFLVALLSPKKVLDLGSGGGFPGIPLAIMNPTIHFTLLDSSAKKTAHLSNATVKLGLSNSEVLCGRAEDLAGSSHHRFAYDLVLAKAVSEPLVITRLAKPLLAPGGTIVSYTGEDRRTGWEELLEKGGSGGGMVIRTVDAGTGEGGRTRLCLVRWNATTPGTPADSQ